MFNVGLILMFKNSYGKIVKIVFGFTIIILFASATILAVKADDVILNNLLKARQANAFFEYKKANDFYNIALKNSPKNQELLQEYLSFSVSIQDLDTAFKIAQQILVYAPEHFLAKLVMVTYDIKKNNLNSALEHLEESKVVSNSLNSMVFMFLEGAIKTKKANKAVLNVSKDVMVYSPDVYYYELATLNMLVNNVDKAKELFLYVNNNYGNVDAVIKYSSIEYKKNPVVAVSYFKNFLSDNYMTDKAVEKYIAKQPQITLQTYMSDVILRLAFLLDDEVKQNILVSDRFLLSNIALMLDPKNQLAIISVGGFYESLGNYVDAINQYTSIDENSYYHRLMTDKIIDIYKQTNQNKKALEFLQKQVKLDSDNPNPFLQMGEIYYDDKKYAKAIDSYNQGIKISEKNNYRLGLWLGHYLRAVSYDKSGEWKKAEKDLLVSYEINSEDPLLVNYLAYSYISRGEKLQESMKMLKNALISSPDQPNILDSYSWALFLDKQYSKALEMSKKAYSILPYDPIINNHLGDMYLQMGKITEAKKYWNTALQLNPDDVTVLEIESKLNGVYPSYITISKSNKVIDEDFVRKVKQGEKA